MSENFRLPTLALASGYEVEPTAMSVPGVVESSDDRALAILEGGYRPVGSACRFLQPSGLVALQLPQGPLPEVLRVVLMVRSDRLADERWSERARRRHDTAVVRGLFPSDGVPDLEVRGRHRLVAVSAQGRLRGHALLVHDGGQDSWVRQRLVFDLAAAELDETRLLLLSFTAAEGPWGAADALPAPLVGFSLRRVRVLEEREQANGIVSTGGAAEDGWSPYSRSVGFAVVNPAPGGGPVTLQVERRTRATGGRLLGSRTRRGADEPLDLEVIDAAGAPIAIPDVVRPSPERGEVVLPPGHGPLHVRLTAATVSAAGDLYLRAAPLPG